MTTKVTILNRDEILGAIIRALAVQAAGFQVVGGMNAEYLKQNGFYRFPFASLDQVERFKTLVKDYVPDRFHNSLQIAQDTKTP
jgi:hypothetical protein